MNIKTPVIEAIKSIKINRYFETHIYNRGRALVYNNAVDNVSVLNDNLIKANVRGSQIYNLEIELKANNSLSLKCDCLYSGYCKHLAALVNYIQDNSEIMEVNNQIKSQKDLYSYTIGFINTLKKAMNSYYQYKDRNLIDKLKDIIVNNTIELINEEKTEQNFSLFFTVLSLFESINIVDEYLVKLKDQFSKINNNPLDEYLKCWQKYFKDKILYDVYDNVVSTMKVTNLEEASGFIKFINYTIKLIKTNNFYYKNTIELHFLKTEYIDKFSIIVIDLLEKYFSEEEVLEFIKANSVGNENIEQRYLDFLLNKKNTEELLNYIEGNELTFSYGKIIYSSIKLENNLIKSKDYINEVSKIFKENINLNNFHLIFKLTPHNVFEEMKPLLLKIAKKIDKYIYYEMEIYLDPSSAYDLIKSAGILVFDKHVNHYIDSKEEEIILYYQEELINYFKRYKNVGVKFNEILSAVKNLTNMKNGVYYLFSVYRIAKEEYSYYENTTALDILYDFIKTFKM